jgi:hypothetical protein
MKAARQRSRFVRDLEEGRQSDAKCAARPSRSAETRLAIVAYCGFGRKTAIREQDRSHAQLAREVRRCS